MDKLEHVNITFDPNDCVKITEEGHQVGRMNFAEAALLIQGTSVIYSRKVEYLHALVYQTLAHMSRQEDDKGPNKQNRETGEEEKEGSDRDNEGGGRSVFNNPLPLYDELEEAKTSSISLKKAEENEENTQIDRNWRRTEAKALNRSKNNIQASIALMGLLVPDERDHGETFKLLSCNLHASGALLLDETSKKYLKLQERAVVHAFGETPGRHEDMWVAVNGDNPAPTLTFDDMDASDDDDRCDNATDDHADYEYDTGTALHSARMDDAAADKAQQKGAVAGELSFLTAQATNTLSAGPEDLWAPLDAYDASTSVALPFKKGRSYPRVPVYKKRKADLVALNNKEGVVGVDDDAVQDGLSDPAFLDRFFMGSNGLQWASWVWTETTDNNSLEKACKRTFCRAPVLLKTCDVLWQREAKWRSIMRRSDAREKQSAEAMLLREQATEEEASGSDHLQALTLSTATARLDMVFRNDVNGRNDKNEENGSESDYDDGFDDGDWEQGNDTNALTGLNETVAAVAKTSDEPFTYDEICRQHLASFMSGTEKYVRETDLSKQVSEWQEKLTPLLKQQDARLPFDIHHYGCEIIEHLEEEHKSAIFHKHGKSIKRKTNKRARLNPGLEDEEEKDIKVLFETLVDGKSQFEVCRVFLATLQLANSGNVSLLHAHTAVEHEQVPFEIKLLTSANTYEALQS
ncbi:unnamed protein product [Peronospora belbahrii]|uniref:Condensin-2 complex subunit H2 C-terminal domain-containing protein n=1 Tax=Peronospora belbahrii TaxID=622444 RepID=A0ABN8CSJ6_9STRA|nr:unnamed protein product [Peronospora belbahrii]